MFQLLTDIRSYLSKLSDNNNKNNSERRQPTEFNMKNISKKSLSKSKTKYYVLKSKIDEEEIEGYNNNAVGIDEDDDDADEYGDCGDGIHLNNHANSYDNDDYNDDDNNDNDDDDVNNNNNDSVMMFPRVYLHTNKDINSNMNINYNFSHSLFCDNDFAGGGGDSSDKDHDCHRRQRRSTAIDDMNNVLDKFDCIISPRIENPSTPIVIIYIDSIFIFLFWDKYIFCLECNISFLSYEN